MGHVFVDTAIGRLVVRSYSANHVPHEGKWVLSSRPGGTIFVGPVTQPLATSPCRMITQCLTNIVSDEEFRKVKRMELADQLRVRASRQPVVVAWDAYLEATQAAARRATWPITEHALETMKVLVSEMVDAAWLAEMSSLPRLEAAEDQADR